MDLTGQGLLKNCDAPAIKDADSFGGKIYQVNTCRYAFTGVFYNRDLFAKCKVKVPTTWKELVAGYGILLSEYTDQASLVKGLWEGTIKWNDAPSPLTCGRRCRSSPATSSRRALPASAPTTRPTTSTS